MLDCVVPLNYYYFNGTDLQIIEHPKSDTHEYCSPVILSVSAVGSGSLSYQWKKNGEDITRDQPDFSGTDTSNLKISSFMPENQGSYTCIVSDGQTFVESNPAELKLSKH